MNEKIRKQNGEVAYIYNVQTIISIKKINN